MELTTHFPKQFEFTAFCLLFCLAVFELSLQASYTSLQKTTPKEVELIKGVMLKIIILNGNDCKISKNAKTPE